MNYGMTRQQHDSKDTLSAFTVIKDTFFTPDGVALTSEAHPINPMTGMFNTLTPEQQKSALEYCGKESFGDPAYRLNAASIVTVELSEEQVKKIKEGSTNGLRLSPKRGRGRPKIVDPRPWEIAGVSRKTWYKRRKKDD
jgi:hypothetical protein